MAYIGAGITRFNTADDLTVTDDAEIGGDLTVTGSADINGGTIDGVIIGGASAGAGTFTTFTSNGIDDNATSTAITIDSSENVGIGTTPSGFLTNGYVLRLNGGSQTYLAFNNDTHTTQATGGFVIGTDANRAYITQRENQPLTFLTNNTEAMRIDSSGDAIIGSSTKTHNAKLTVRKTGGVNTTIAAWTDGANSTGKLSIRSSATVGIGSDGNLAFSTGEVGVDTFNERMRIDSSGNVNMGDYFGASNHRINKRLSESGYILAISGYPAVNQDTARFFTVNGGGANGANTAFLVQKNSSTNRSINAAGTINASGADYAEYMVKSGDFEICKGDICGIDSNGELTNVFVDSISFVVKSTNPSYVGGDTWGASEKPEEPTQKVEEFDEDGNQTQAAETDEEFATRQAQYESDLADWESNLEAERQKVDRIAFSGQVPVNVTGATAGQYIVPVEDSGAITGIAVDESDMTLAQYMKAVGKVIAIEDDGRAKIIVKVA